LSLKDDTLLSAQVVVQHSTAEVASRVVAHFRSAGFDVGPIVAGNFAITGPRALFDDYFGITPQAASGAADPSAGSHELPASLPLDRLPGTIRPLVRLIAFTRDYGPAHR
jgi:hypothetical protein